MSLKKTNCSFEIHVANLSLILEAMILEITLYTKLQREIGLNSWKELGFSSFGISVRKVAFNEPHTLPKVLYSSTSFSNYLPIISKKWWNNSWVYPSGLGLLSFVIFSTIFSSSCSVNCLPTSFLSLSVKNIGTSFSTLSWVDVSSLSFSF